MIPRNANFSPKRYTIIRIIEIKPINTKVAHKVATMKCALELEELFALFRRDLATSLAVAFSHNGLHRLVSGAGAKWRAYHHMTIEGRPSIRSDPML